MGLRPRAKADIEDIWSYTVETWSEGHAVAYLTGLDAAFRLLSEFPDMARLRQAFSPPVRIHPNRQHLILFQADDDTFDVVRVVHSRASWAVYLAD